MRKIRAQLTYANVVSTLCLFLLLTGGSALAAATLGKNSVGSRQLKSKSVTTGKIALNAVNGSKVANGSLSGADINLGALGTVPSATSAAIGRQLEHRRRPRGLLPFRHHPDPRPLLRLHPKRGRQQRHRSRRCLRGQGRLPAQPA